MDGSSKGGIAIAVQSELGIPVKYIGVGEHLEDLQRFDPDEFVRALFDTEPEETGSGETPEEEESGRNANGEAGGGPEGAEDTPGTKESAETSSKEPEKEDDEEDPWAFFASMQDAKNGR